MKQSSSYIQFSSPPCPWLLHLQFQPTTDGKHSGEKIIPVSSTKQQLNTQRTGNYFHSVYIVFTTISIALTLLGIINNLSRDDLEYMGGPMGYMWLHYFIHGTLQISGSVASPGTKPSRHLGTTVLHCPVHSSTLHSLGVHGASHLQERRECAGPHMHGPRRGRQPGAIWPSPGHAEAAGQPLPVLPTPQLKMFFSAPRKWGNAGHQVPTHCTWQCGRRVPTPTAFPVTKASAPWAGWPCRFQVKGDLEQTHHD